MRRGGWLVCAVVLAACDAGPTFVVGDPVPAGGRIFFVRTPLDPVAGVSGALHMTIDDAFRAVPVAPRDVAPIVSPDGRHLAWTRTSWPDGYSARSVTRFYSYDRHTGDTTIVIPEEMRAGSLSWSRAPIRLAFVRTPRDGGPGVFVTTESDGSDLRMPLGETAVAGSQPSISPDAREVAVIRDRRLELVDLGTGMRRQLTPVPDSGTYVTLSSPAWSPDGRMIAMSVAESFSPQIILRVVDRLGAIRHELEVHDWPSYTTWAPDGERLAFCVSLPDPARGRYRYRQEVRIWHMARGEVVTITPPDVSDCAPTWTR